jgi:hypothetical protein
MSHQKDSVSRWTGTVFVAGLGIGIAVGIALGSVVAIRLGSETVDAVRGLIDRMSGRGNQVHFELLLQ